MRRNLIFTRDLSTPLPAPAWPEGMTVHTLTHPSDDGFALMDRMYVSNGFRPGWAADLLKGTVRAIVAIAPSGEAAAAAWLLREPFYVSEIERTFDPGPEGDYYFGDFVAPEFRGRGVQSAAILHRLAVSTAEGRRWAMAMTSESNAASCKNYQACGFAVAGSLSTRWRGKIAIDIFRHIDASRPFGSISHRGFRLPFGVEIYRRR